VPRRVVAAAAVLPGSRLGIDLPDRDIDRVKSHLATSYDKMDDDAAWQRDG
jgi:hypothetical protein